MPTIVWRESVKENEKLLKATNARINITLLDKSF